MFGSRTLTALSFAVIVFLLDHSAPATASPSIAKFTVSERHAEWLPLVEGDAILRIAFPNGEVREFSFDGKTSPFVRFEPASAWADGAYAYELTIRRPLGAGGVSHQRQSGFFRITEGAGVPNGVREAAGLRSLPQPGLGRAAAPDQLLGDDLILQGAACVGADCTNGETFGNDTLRLKGSVLRLHAQDTSSGSFPTGDWRLLFNDTSPGADYMGIEDATGPTTPLRIMAGAPTDSFFMTPLGRVGFGTVGPSSRVHVRGVTGDGTAKITVEETSATAAPRELLELRNKGGAAFIMKDLSASERWSNGAFSSNYVINNQALAGVEYTFGPTGNLTIAGTLTQLSSRESKQDLEPIDPSELLEKLATLPILEWSYRTDPTTRHVGPIAQDFKAAFGLGATDTGIASVDADGVALAALQALYRMVREENRQLRERLERLEALSRPDTAPAAARIDRPTGKHRDRR